MNHIALENFRCFRERQETRMAPLTLLVGENSAGKTSFLALIRALWEAAYEQRVPDFKAPPYDLGSFDEIAHFRGGRGGRATEFHAEFRRRDDLDNRPKRGRPARPLDRTFALSFRKEGTAPVPHRWAISTGDAAVEVGAPEQDEARVYFRTVRGQWSWPRRWLGEQFPGNPQLSFPLILSFLPERDSAQPTAGSPLPNERDWNHLRETIAPFFPSGQRLFASAPVRSKPRRTYDPARPTAAPEGETIPTYLSSLFVEDRRAWTKLKGALEAFGRQAGLFDELDVRLLGKKGTEPFQVQIRKYGKRAKGPSRNLIDVGYGVSQVLPVLTELFRDRRTSMFLLQQPEVHLHPQAQAAFGSLFCRLASWKRQIVVETHSDHLLDRVRMDVRDGHGRLSPEDVSILYFERQNLGFRIYSLRLDDQGNVLDAPQSYRRFFMEEVNRSLGL